MKGSITYIANSLFWSSIAKILNAGLRFVSIPLLLSYFGKESYGLIALAIAANAYTKLLNMGINTGAVKFFAQWIAANDYDRIHRVARTNITLYVSLGVLNSLILLSLATWGDSVFQITPGQFAEFRNLLFIIAAVSVVEWSIFVFFQLLVADEKIAFTQQILSLRNILNLVIVLLTIYFKWDIIHYFLYDTVISAMVIVPYYVVCKNRNLIQSIAPGFYWKDFSVVIKYSLAIFAMALFQFTATQSRPIVLGMFTNQGSSILSDYQVIEVFPLFIISIGGMLISILLPKTSQAIQRKDRETIEKMAYEGTKYTSILVAFLCFPIMLCTKELLTLYVGDNYTHLSIWLLLWVFTLSLFLHNTPVASLILATGKTKVLVFSSAIACIISIAINALLCIKFGVGSAVIGYLVYIIIQLLFYYLYFNNKVLGLDSLRVFKSFAMPTGLGLVAMICIYVLDIHLYSLLLSIVIKSVLWCVCFIVLLFATKQLNYTKITL